MTKVLTLTLILFLGLVVTDVSSQAIGADIPNIVIGYCEAYNTCTLRCRSVCLGMPILFPFWGCDYNEDCPQPYSYQCICWRS